MIALKQALLRLIALASLAHLLRGDETILASQRPDGTTSGAMSSSTDLSADGRFVVFWSYASDLVPGDTNGTGDVFVRDMELGMTERVSVATDESEGDGYSDDGVVSGDGRFVAFASNSSFDAGDGNGSYDVYLRDRLAGTTSLVTRSPSGSAAGGFEPSISRDGGFVAFVSWATDLVPETSNGLNQVFTWERSTGAIRLASVTVGGEEANNISLSSRISDDGAVVAFETSATNFPDVNDPNTSVRVYAKDLGTGLLERVDPGVQVPGRSGSASLGDLSPDGRFVLFNSHASFLPEDTNYPAGDAFVLDRALDSIERVSLGNGGEELVEGGGGSSFSDDARKVLFGTSAAAGKDDENGQGDVFVHDRDSRVTLLTSVGEEDQQGSALSFRGSMSADGLVVAFTSYSSNLVSGDDDNFPDVFVRKRCDAKASWTRYGTGFPGRDGVVPMLTPSAEPYRGTSITIDLTNPARLYTIAFLFIGLTRNSIPTSLGGMLLLDPIVLLPWALSPYGGQLEADIPTESWACGLVVDLQALELDPFAAEGVSFSEGLELTLGD